MVTMITKRKSVRSYTNQTISQELLEKIDAFQMKPLNPDIQVCWRWVTKEQVRSICPFLPKQLIAVYSEKKDGYLENAGFMFQQMELYLQKLGLGVCWLGLGKLRKPLEEIPPEMDFVILLTVGYPEGEAYRKDTSEFKRDGMDEIADRADPRLEPARLAPSSCNSQPWYFVHDGEEIHTFWNQKGLIKRKVLAYFNPIDMGIALAHLYVSNPATFCFFRREGVQVPKGHKYIGSFTL